MNDGQITLPIKNAALMQFLQDLGEANRHYVSLHPANDFFITLWIGKTMIDWYDLQGKIYRDEHRYVRIGPEVKKELVSSKEYSNK